MWGEKIKPQILLNQTDDVNLDGHLIIRGLLVSRRYISELEDEVGGKVIQDHEADVLNVLDEAAEYIRVRNRGRYTPHRTLEIQNEQFVHRDLIISDKVFGFQWGMNTNFGTVNIGGIKKMWFRLPMTFGINKSRPKGLLI